MPSDAPDWEKICIEPFTCLILGQRGSGKTALGHLLLEVFGENTDRDAYILGFPEHLRDQLPEWIDVLPPETGMESWPEESVVLIHEAHMLVHARRSQNAENVELDELVTISRHKDSDIIFETQQSQRLDKNAVTAADAIIFREPALMQSDFERGGMKKIVNAADDYFEQFVEETETDDYTFRQKTDAVKKHAYVHSGRFIGGYPHEIGLADHWSESISKAYAEVAPESAEGGDGGDDGLSEEERACLEAAAEWEADHRPLSHEISGVEHDDMPVPHSWNYLKSLCGKQLLEKVYDSNSATHYRLTEEGWEKAHTEEPDGPVVAADD